MEHKRSTVESRGMEVVEKVGAGDGTRTRDVQLGKLVVCEALVQWLTWPF